MNQLGLVQHVDGFGQRVVITVALAAHRWLYTRLLQPFGVAYGNVLTSPVGVARQGIGYWLAFVQGLFQRILHKVCLHAASDPAAHDAPGVHIHHEGNVQPPLPGGDMREV